MLTPCKECGKPISSRVRICPQCGAPQPSGAMVKIGLLALLVSGLVATAVAFVHNNKSGPAGQSTTTAAAAEQDEFADAKASLRETCERFVKVALLSPATADFAPPEEWVETVLDKTTVRLRGWVDSQNSFGAMIRSRFTVGLAIDDKALKLIYLKFDGDRHPKIGTELLTTEERADKEARIAAAKATAQRQAELDAKIYHQRQLDSIQADEDQKKAHNARRDEDARIAAEREEKYHREQQERAVAKAESDKAADEALYHTWKSADGQFTLDAKIKSYANGNVVLVGRDGGEKKVDRAKLSDDDQPVIDRWIRNAATPIVHAPPKSTEAPKNKPLDVRSNRR